MAYLSKTIIRKKRGGYMSIKKEFVDGRSCKVTFQIPKRISKRAKSAHVVGSFNNWSQWTTPMKKMKNGEFCIAIELPVGREYEFRYLLDNQNWVNEPEAESFVPTPFGDNKNCVLTTINDAVLKSILESIKTNQRRPRLTDRR